jgi:H+/Cl- antiporter ClcA
MEHKHIQDHINWQRILHKSRHNLKRTLSTVKWILGAIIIGIIVGFVSGAFGYCLQWVTQLRLLHPRLLLLLPFGAMVIVGLYQLLLHQKDPGTNLVLSAIHSDDEIPLQMAPLIFISTVITHLVGGSAGREGAALQLGGSIGNAFGHHLGFTSKDDRHIMIMCGMSAAFSALFGTPLAAAVFSMEVVSVGIMHYAALLPCTISALIARAVASEIFHIAAPSYEILDLPEFQLTSALVVSLLAILCGLVSILFCVMLHQTGHLYQKFLKSPYLRAFAGGCIILLLTIAVGSQTYNGTGAAMIAACIRGEISDGTFLLKMIFTAATLACGYKGGEIVPSFFIGAAFGSLFGNLAGFSPSLCAALGMGALFCGVTNCPITSLLICFELFGLQGAPYFLIAISFSYTVSGYFGLYSSQKIVYSKYKSNYIDKQAL